MRGLFVLLAIVATAGGAAAQQPAFQGHPRLLFTGADVPALRLQLQDGGDDDAAWTAIRNWATGSLGVNPLALLGSWEGAHTVSQLCLAAHVDSSGGPAFAAKARDVVLYLARNRAPTNDEFASALRLQSLAYGYDMAGADATPGERAELQQEMRDYLDWMPPRFNFYCQAYNPYAGNHGMTVGASMGLAVIALWDDVSESGRDSLQTSLAFADQLVAKCLTDILAPDGSYREGVLYAGWIIRMAAPYFEARRRFDGTDLAADPRVQGMIEWLCYELDPTGGGRTLNLNDSPWSTRPLALHNTLLEWAQMRWGSGLARYLHNHVVGTYGYNHGHFADRVSTALWSRRIWDIAPSTLLAPSRLFADRGLYFYRNGWKTGATGDEMLFSFFSGKFYGGHAQEDQNQYTLTAYGRRWVVDCGGVGASATPKETAAHNLILVDGRGQHNAGNSVGTDGAMAAALLGGFADYLRGDARAAYATYSPFNAPGAPFPTSDWSWGYDGGNALERADRQCLVVKGSDTPPYVVIADDVQKDAAPHAYEWLLHTDASHSVDLTTDPVRINATPAQLDVYFAHPRPADLQLSSASFVHLGVDPATRRLVARAQMTEPRFCVALVPRAPGMQAPVYETMDDGSSTLLSLDWGNVLDLIVFSPHQQPGSGAVVTDGRMAAVRRDGAGVRRWLLAEGTMLRAGTLPLASLSEAASVACNVDSVFISRADVGFSLWAPGATTLIGPQGPMMFRRDGERIRNLEPTDVAVGDDHHGLWLAPARNPVRHGATLHFRIPSSGPVRIVVVDVRGARVATLLDASRAAGEHAVRWDGRDTIGQTCAPGIYFIVLEAHRARTTRKLILTR